MIDTDRYEGHTPEPWIALNDNAVGTPKHNDPYAFIERRNDDGYVVALSKADAQLIADAPKLLAEVKRLREEILYFAEYLEDKVTPYMTNDMHEVVPIGGMVSDLHEMIKGDD